MKKLALLALLGTLAFGSPQPAQALDFYVDTGAGALFPSDSNIQKIYGTMLEIKVGGGIESNGWGGELGVICSFGNKTTNSSMAGLTTESSLTNLEFAARFQKAFGTRGESIRPYLGLQLSYASSKESAKVKYLVLDLTDASVIESGIGFGAFAGVDFPLSKKLLLYLEGMYESAQLSPEVNSKDKGVDVSGISGTIGLKYYF